ncbi:GntR family transcriptional regulator [Streptomyces sp. NBC_01267]|uniref:GntR family transcriptional regulator n=1 Tax=unclassified Streptomyces TaxID=2593676 RepID=UPI0022561579|nr:MULTISPECIES: GntR family transcriptional regulator [unclassified Streptomyces]MCX4550217.1 GntR family transcriptional regulator [Streptomyces sp. NBC_01500]WSC21711.1 GntR family transcriptional regulator [Streptomyces sp. NBC_01766]WSV55670.1 GntR family transcriptional regulator [Streptomyces sp. NBC_01014]
MVAFRIDRHSGVATYLQIVHQVKTALRLGALEPGDRLPTTRQVVEATAINPNTVLKAYRELEREGLVEPRPGKGTFVSRSLSRPEAAAGSPLRAELADWLARAREAGLEREDVTALVADALDESHPRTQNIPRSQGTPRSQDSPRSSKPRSSKPGSSKPDSSEPDSLEEEE